MNYKLLLCFLVLFAVLGCSDKLGELKVSEFEVYTDSLVYKVGDPVVFRFSGDIPSNLMLYTGESYNDYAFKDGRSVDIEGQGVSVGFSTIYQGTTGTQNNQLSVWVSNDYNGKGNISGIESATWQDVTSLFNIATTGTKVSTSADLSTYFEMDQPVFFAFKFRTLPQVTNGITRTLAVDGFTVNSLVSDDITTNKQVYTQAAAGFYLTDSPFPEQAPTRTVLSSTSMRFQGNEYKDPNDPIYDPDNPIYDPGNPIYDPQDPAYIAGAKVPTYVPYDPDSPYNDPTTEAWVISKPLYAHSLNYGGDKPINIKGITTKSQFTEYEYVYNTPGVYKVVIVGKNHTADGQTEVVKRITLEVTE